MEQKQTFSHKRMCLYSEHFFPEPLPDIYVQVSARDIRHRKPLS